MEIPELEFELGMAVLGGKFTTLEGMLKDIRELVSARRIAHAASQCGRGGTGSKASKVLGFGADNRGFFISKLI